MRRLVLLALPLLLAAPAVAADAPVTLAVSIRVKKKKVPLLARVPIEVTVVNRGRGAVDLPPLRIADDAVTIVLREGEREFRLRRLHGRWVEGKLDPEAVARDALRPGRSVKEVLEIVAVRPGTYELRAEVRGFDGLDPADPPASRPSELIVVPPPEGKALRATIRTSYGLMKAELFPDEAFNSCHEFVLHAQDGYFGNGMTFFRVVEQFMAQTGSPNNSTSGYGYWLPAEFSERKHVRGALSLARRSHVDSADGQFFVMFADKPGLDGKYSVFGQLVSGLEVLDRIEKVEKEPNPNNREEISRPKSRIELYGVEVGLEDVAAADR